LVTFLAIITHIWAEAFTLSTAMLKARVSVTNTVKSMLGFSCITPGAIFLGMGLGQLLEGLTFPPLSSPSFFGESSLSFFSLRVRVRVRVRCGVSVDLSGWRVSPIRVRYVARVAASAVSVVSAILVSFAAGTFLYVNMEIMTEEFANPHHKWTKLALLLAGFAFMSVLGFVV
jgi:hypothetical protein